MLPARHRLRRAVDFRTTSRAARAGRSALVVHLAAGSEAAARSQAPPQVGFTVGRGVGNSVVRHRVSRRLREAVRPLIAELPAGARIVVRALPDAATTPMVELRRQFKSAVGSLLARRVR